MHRSVLRRMRIAVVACVIGFVAFLVLGNVVIYTAHVWAQATASAAEDESFPGIDNFRQVDEVLWRGAAPTPVGYRMLATSGVKTIIDLRTDEVLGSDAPLVEDLGMELVRIPLRDGQAPTTDQVRQFLGAAEGSEGRVFVHCGAGVGRTGTMVGAWLVEHGNTDSAEAVRANLSVGPPSLEQLAFVASLDEGEVEKPGAFVTTMSRVLDGPRRILVRLDF